ncbi:methylated-DNA--[protein]-cysteine S-methyltransferase [Usitatibacter palustris]|uniref:Methylated-DNA--protein-cysteine methyltransferase n=1 Tax=Usitatibacter palustris TaxID=2732487 RepID=A0A6M4H1Q3_9PROT|nr:methylated-DNA--[protein]-cysteine S-methyltransferase [Usitatibacter palustris]QJR13429.1 Methylated-DNA--protein-cysteine methyltransferase [Usitatibacter palustris]
MIRYKTFTSPLGTMLAAANEHGLTRVDFIDSKYMRPVDPDWQEDTKHPSLVACEKQLAEYFEGERAVFDLPLNPRGTPFQKRIWEEISGVAYGETIIYSELARRAGSPGSSRAAGAATGRNPIAIIVPCHRIVGADGSLTGYAGGLPRKTRLLELEGVLQGSLV